MRREKRPWGEELIPTQEGERPGRIVRDRALFVQDEHFSLEPDSMVGSWFLVLFNRSPMWKGVVCGEPQAGQYLCWLERLEGGAERVQRVFTMDTFLGLPEAAKRFIEGAYGMENNQASVVEPALEWQFFDSDKQASAAWANWSARTRQEA
jgi:hypothetical protein